MNIPIDVRSMPFKCVLLFLVTTNFLYSQVDIKVKSDQGEITEISSNLQISGVYPHLTTYAHASENGTYTFGTECGIGALAVWKGKLYMINYADHRPQGSNHKLYIVDGDKTMQIFQKSIGGTPAGRMVHQESNQLFIGPYVIDSEGNIRVIPYTEMPGRLTAVARHLKDPKNMVYYYDMEGMLYEVNVHTLAVKRLFEDPLPGWHGKGAYVSQGKLILANNGENTANDKWEDKWEIPKKEGIICKDCKGVLAEFDGEHFKVVERKQYTEVTTQHGINAIPNENAPLWAMGWDKKSIRLAVLDHGKWTFYRLPKATNNNDPQHGWFTEWPRIRSIGKHRMMADMHGMFFDFPENFSTDHTAGLRPISSHLRYVPDFLEWNGQIVLATDETSIQGNPLAGQPQSNLWFGSYEQLSNWGPASGYGSLWLKEKVIANMPSEPFLINGFDRKLLHLYNHSREKTIITLQIDKEGKGKWQVLDKIKINGNSYIPFFISEKIEAQWIRLIADSPVTLTASMHLTTKKYHDKPEEKKQFEGLASIDYTGNIAFAKLYSNGSNFDLSYYTGSIQDDEFVSEKGYTFSKKGFTFSEGITDSKANNALKSLEKSSKETDPVIIKGNASNIIQTQNYRLRIPLGNKNYGEKLPYQAVRVTREVESERTMINVAGTFYEVPLHTVGKEPVYKMMRPVATHNKQIIDFNTWNGLLVLSGVKEDAPISEHIYKSEDGKKALWFGAIDDLWYFGKPVGEGGVWKNTPVKANQLSDHYLMTGYDKKKLILQSDKSVTISLFIYVAQYLDEPFLYKTFELRAGKKLEYEFPEGFSAHTVQLKTDKDCTATAWFLYE